jgi:hypothetical protein
LALTLPLLVLAPPATADFRGIPLVRQPFVKFCPDGSIVGSLGPNFPAEDEEAEFGAFAYDPRTEQTGFLRRVPGFERRLAANPCVRTPLRSDRER